jgi:hypothetical protein
MSGLLNSLKSDLSDRRLLPFVIALAAVLVAAVAYAILGGGSSAKPLAAVAPVHMPATGPALPVTQAPANPNAAVSETTDGTHFQHHSGSHNPFKPLVSPAAASSSGGASSSSTSSSSGKSGSATGGGSSPSSSGGSAPTTPAEPEPTPAPKKAKSKSVYVVDVLFGLAPTTPGQLSQLTPYPGVRRLEPLPSASDPRVVFAGVDSSGKGAIFTLAGEAILHGQGTCMPSATQCEAVVLAAGQVEEFTYLEASGSTAVYELKVERISKRQASAARAARLQRRSHAGLVLERRLALPLLRHLRFSAAKGVLVYASHRRHR